MLQTRSLSLSASKRKSGFSLTELLVFLGVIAVITAVLFPVLATSRRKAQDADCVQHLRQLGQALNMYVSDYDGAYPMGVEGVLVSPEVEDNTRIWADLLLPYVHANTIPACPLRDTSQLEAEEEHLSSYCGYVLNARLLRRRGTQQRYIQQGRSETILTYPSLTVTLCDARIGMVDARSPDTALTIESLNQFFHRTLRPDNAAFYLAQPPGGTRHHGGAHYAFADGHVKWLQPSALSVSKKSDGQYPGFGL